MRVIRERIKRTKRAQRFRTPEARVVARVETSTEGTILHIGDRKVVTRLIDRSQPTHDVHDYAAFALAAVSMSRNIEIDIDFPISIVMAKRLEKIAQVYRLWSIDMLAPMRVNVKEAVDTTPEPRQGGVICLSGGLDSMFAAIEAKQEGAVDHALLIAGADYETAAAHGFVELQQRVGGIAEKLGLNLMTVETDLRRVGFEWQMLHGFALAYCLHFLSPLVARGAFALDYTIYQDLMRAPWGNNSAIPPLCSTDHFQLRGYGLYSDRVEKLRRVTETDESLLHHLSICYSDTSTGGNCGRCRKCLLTRAALVAIGASEQGLFSETPDIADGIATLPLPTKIPGIRGVMARAAELADTLPDGRLRDTFVTMEEQLRARYLALMPPN